MVQPRSVGPDRNLITILARGAADPAQRGRVAVSCREQELTFEQLHSRSLRLAAGSVAAGLEFGDRVAVLLPNRLEWVELLFGVTAMGGVLVPVNILLRASEVAHVCEDSGSRWLIADAASLAALDEIPACVEKLIVVGDGAGPRATPYEDLFAAEEHQGQRPGPEDLSVIYYSSGTTGKPKGAALTHSSLCWNSIGQMVDIGFSADDVHLVVPSLSWAAGFNNVFLPLLWAGGRAVILPSDETNIDLIVENFERSGATRAMLVPTLLKQLLDRADLLERMRRTELRWVMTGAEPIPKTVIERFREALPKTQLAQAYGMSEFPTIATILRHEDTAEHTETAGKTLIHTEMAVRTDEGEIVREGEGEVLLRSLAAMAGYYGDEEETERVFADGWFASGDRGRIDAEGYLTITGRVKDMIISGGLNVYPPEIEDVLYRLEGVTEACVVGVADERWGEVPAALIVSEREDWEEAAVIEHCRRELASYKCPKHVIVRTEKLPRNPSGKVLKREVVPWVSDRLGLRAQKENEGKNAYAH